MFTALAHWKMHLADYFSWLRDENWHKRKQEEMMARYPALHAAHETLVEVHTFEGPFIGRIYKATLYNERDGYLIEMFEPAQTELERGLDDRRLATELLEGHGYPGMEVYGSLEEARAALPEALKQALEQ